MESMQIYFEEITKMRVSSSFIILYNQANFESVRYRYYNLQMGICIIPPQLFMWSSKWVAGLRPIFWATASVVAVIRIYPFRMFAQLPI